MMETETLVMTSRRRMVIKPLSLAETLQSKKSNLLEEAKDSSPIPSPATSEKKRILLQESELPIIPTVQRSKVKLSCTISNNLTDTDDSDSNDSTLNDNPTEKNKPSNNKKTYYAITLFLCWAAIQYWMIAVAGFGAVFFAVSALIAIYINTGTGNKRNVLSAYSVFNPQCTPIQGSADPKQLERELIFGGL
ncbi:uncharacterized protein LOC112692071 [Sipha flava]|uniref:Uncharacterized protein LOC112692071 n=1 Tax=Sipha flava TaxID=143950 RepID=A0A2S2QWB0_9HEMI|nr:uncharacterized protein LOC112692071 [Sipha flava]XP_025422402.1 uncharacterized protein LOC112692071 [Sipha flava]XP_025422409.1 uncharacterized protein LOC112692071 [Sipha flava]